MFGNDSVSWASCAANTATAFIHWLINTTEKIILIVWFTIVFEWRRRICYFLFFDFLFHNNFFIWLVLNNLVNDSALFISLSPYSIHLCLWYCWTCHSLSSINCIELLSLNFVEIISRSELSIRNVYVVFLYMKSNTNRWSYPGPRTRYSLLTTDDWAALEVNTRWRSTIYGCYKVYFKGL